MSDIGPGSSFHRGNYNSIFELQPLGMLINYIIPAMLPKISPRQITKLDSMALDSYVGEYQLEPSHIRVSVFKKSDKLYCNILGRTIQVYPEAKDLFLSLMIYWVTGHLKSKGIKR